MADIIESQEEQSFHQSPFEAIRRETEDGYEYWSARELAKLLGYATNYRNFKPALEKAKEACKQSGQAISDHFAETRNMIQVGKGAQREIDDMHLSRYACYLTLQNADPEKPIVALSQTYFAVQTRRQELADELALTDLPEDEKRLIMRREITVLNSQLAKVARRAGVIKPEHFAIFEDRGYQGLYDGETENRIHSRKRLKKGEKILDFMGSDEFAANVFRASLARQRLERDGTQKREEANEIHYQAGRHVRKSIEEFGGTLPEQLSTPKKSIQQLQREEQKRLEQKQQPPLFDEGDL